MRQASKSYKGYKSPVRKLVQFFEESRDRWKGKCVEAKAQVKGLKNRVRFLEESRGRWAEEAKVQEAAVEELKRAKARLEREVSELKEREKAEGEQGEMEAFEIIPSHHTYSVGHVALCIDLVLSAATSLRATVRIFESVTTAFGLGLRSPTWYSVRLWLLRVGYYKLTRPKAVGTDWVWIVDHSIQLGEEKCFVILGVRLCELPLPERCLGHEDVEPLNLFPVKKSNGEVVFQQLEETIAKTGIPRAIVGRTHVPFRERGLILHAGVQKFCQAHPKTDYIYDIKHKTAGLLKHELADDPTWLAFRGLASLCKSQVQQTALAALAPPQQKSKARYMNIDSLVEWGDKMLTFFDTHPSASTSPFDPILVEQKLGWIKDYRADIAEWRQLLSDVVSVEIFVRKGGLYQGASQSLGQEFSPLEITTDRISRVRQHLLDFVSDQEALARPRERLLASSEVLESVFGKFKRIEQQQARSGFTGLLLSVAAMVSTTTTDVIHTALETVSTQSMLEWCQQNLGKSLLSLRRGAFAAHKHSEQKRDLLLKLT